MLNFIVGVIVVMILIWLRDKIHDRLRNPYRYSCRECTFKANGNDKVMINKIAFEHTLWKHDS